MEAVKKMEEIWGSNQTPEDDAYGMLRYFRYQKHIGHEVYPYAQGEGVISMWCATCSKEIEVIGD